MFTFQTVEQIDINADFDFFDLDDPRHPLNTTNNQEETVGVGVEDDGGENYESNLEGAVGGNVSVK